MRNPSRSAKGVWPEWLAAGFEVVPTFRTPHVTIAFQGDLDSALAVLVTLGIDRHPASVMIVSPK